MTVRVAHTTLGIGHAAAAEHVEAFPDAKIAT
jgi:hypothetical protein